MSLRVGIWPSPGEAALSPLRSAPSIKLVEDWPRHRWPALLWPRRVTSPLLAGADAVEEALSSWPAWLFDAALVRARGCRWALLGYFLMLPLCWLGIAASQLLLAVLRTLLAPVRGYDALAEMLSRHLLSSEEQVARAGCDVWL